MNEETKKVDPIAKWRRAEGKFAAALPKHREYYAPGRWRYAMTDDERLAAGWVRTEGWASETDPEKIAAWKPKDAADLARGPMRSLGMVNWLLTRPDPIRKASLALADATGDLAVEIERRGKSSAAAIRLAETLREGFDPGQHTKAAIDEVHRLLREIEIAATAKGGRRAEAPARIKLDEIDKKFVEKLRTEKRAMGPSELARLADVHRDESVVRRRLNKLAKGDVIKRNGKGLYWHPSVDVKKK